jgi:hypothetical protein
MKKILFSVFILYLGFTFGQNTSFDEKQFFENLKTSYYSLQSTNTQNISVLITNLATESFAEQQWKNPEIFPLQLMWLSPNRLFVSQKGVPALTDSATKAYGNLVDNLKSQITDILFDLKRFYFSDIYNNIPEAYKIVNKNDVVLITFNSLINDDTTHYEYYFGLNGLCLNIISLTPSKHLKIETTPYFKTSKTKWITGGWEVKMYTENEVTTGYFVELKFKDKQNIWIPAEVILTVQRKSDLGKTYNEVLKFRNFLFNQPLHFIEQ